ncbi:hypothetical protein KSX_61190 [Ktedonospora formicarum]|uniref:Uncharacterized protein n=1 Tax=Ktedonospora formicarum TaxID=2778364 RepID=A0A8J3I5V0_9CHLR|nr:hypothetical protein KSX_61190 [Ktedonospora formicarum]
MIWPNALSTNEKFLLEWLLSLINGQRNVAEITDMLPRLRFEDVKNGLLYLRQLGVISLMG